MPQTPMSPTEVRSVFGRNLRQLCDDGPPVTAICQQIGINRTQFNRYLAGEAFPRPDILAKICAHFGVDARILLEPLDDLRSALPDRFLMEMRDKLLIGKSRPVDQNVLPDAMYRFWRKSFMFQGKIVTNVALVKTRDEVTLFKGFEENILAQQENPNARRFPRLAYFGLVRQHLDGVSVYCQDRQNQSNINFFEFGLEGNMRFYPGFSLLVRRRIDGMNRMTAAVLERLPNEPALWRNIVRQETMHDISYAPPIVQRALHRIPDGL
ncbi:helix-turn-helix transcriptional regulator [Gemmobacter fulvus]|uniref:Helix-turn-helix transcriptional regulator n=1 Tax=Gemmobacter fulvus TaxID=2840474 RepID=A0A975P859_9RHOB|nr:helix-turn-helix transcriptional regulator [Gemmobacter fulvus]MBT9247328.1 helix-turn-helix transcriptional regulator [Gemmobacter fulvus]QWK90191.1 helix-turn-helix transcriptional regulator [Gemmobacter fulvus]